MGTSLIFADTLFGVSLFRFVEFLVLFVDGEREGGLVFMFGFELFWGLSGHGLGLFVVGFLLILRVRVHFFVGTDGVCFEVGFGVMGSAHVFLFRFAFVLSLALLFVVLECLQGLDKVESQVFVVRVFIGFDDAAKIIHFLDGKFPRLVDCELQILGLLRVFA